MGEEGIANNQTCQKWFGEFCADRFTFNYTPCSVRVEYTVTYSDGDNIQNISKSIFNFQQLAYLSLFYYAWFPLSKLV